MGRREGGQGREERRQGEGRKENDISLYYHLCKLKTYIKHYMCHKGTYMCKDLFHRVKVSREVTGSGGRA